MGDWRLAVATVCIASGIAGRAIPGTGLMEVQPGTLVCIVLVQPERTSCFLLVLIGRSTSVGSTYADCPLLSHVGHSFPASPPIIMHKMPPSVVFHRSSIEKYM